MRTSFLCPALLLALVANASLAQSVALSGMSGSKALVVIDGSAPRFMSAGQTHQGVRLVSAQDDTAVIEIEGKRQTLRVGDAPVSVGRMAPSGGGGQRIVLTADARGHFMPQGQINGKTVQFMVDTGATGIGIGAAEAQRINLKFEHGQRVQMNTANGSANGYLIKLDSVRLGDVVVYDVAAIVSPQPMPYVLLGNTFLTRFQMQRTNDQLTLEKRY
ncbi:MAG: TIGR02281 family clan AA aspartic protease [Hydrogenophaga sp.]|uniref:retropepsin-like aspartic protease family protein n=1 Tax=Hydrogenophaga sp. TaxID=1904254 RepID=UPI0025C414BA|nr:TIGR02281 family clan AA aspartic protease [Hydrogenophaga sp.]MCG2655357.1 TIGR02281 family clan AA aspartic protease [Hydrogenophaga sp.]